MAQDVKAELWKSLDKLFAYCDKVSWNKNDQQAFKKEVKNFGKAMKEAWTTCNITLITAKYMLDSYFGERQPKFVSEKIFSLQIF